MKDAKWRAAATLSAEQLVTALAIADKYRAKESSLPALTMVLIQTVAPSTIIVRAVDLTGGVVVRFGGKVQINAGLAVRASLVSSLLNGQSGTVMLEVDEAGAAWRICTKYGKDIVRGIAYDEFPTSRVASADRAAPGVSVHENVEVEVTFGGDLFKALHAVSPCMSTDSARPTLASVALFDDGDKLRLVATDGYRVAEYQNLPCKEKRGGFGCMLMPASFVAALQSTLDGCETISLLSDGNTAVLAGETRDGFQIDASTALVDARYPDYKAVLPKGKPAASAVLDAGDFLSSLAAAKLFSKNAAWATNLSISEADCQVTIWTNEGEEGAARRVLAAQDAKGTLDIKANVTYLIAATQAAAKSLGASQLEFSGTQPTRPLTLRVAGNDHWLTVIMPMHPQKTDTPRRPAPVAAGQQESEDEE